MNGSLRQVLKNSPMNTAAYVKFAAINGNSRAELFFEMI
jgi:hypothetical protein